MNTKKIFFLAMLALAVFACNPNEDIIDPIKPEASEVAGLYVLSEGGWGSNNSSLSYFDYAAGSFTNSFFELKNPSEGGLGDLGNDLKIYGSKLYAVMNASNYVEVMNAQTAAHITKIAVPNCRNITFDGGFAYVTSFAGEVSGDGKQFGYVAKIDTADLTEKARVKVGYQPEELTVAGGKLYVANSGGYNAVPSDEISVIDLATFTVQKTISTGTPNITKIRADRNGILWTAAAENSWIGVSAALSAINPQTEKVVKTLNINVSNFDICGDSIFYYYGSYTDAEQHIFGIIDINSKTQISANFITDGTYRDIMYPYGLIINKFNGDIFIGDALDWSSPGKVYCFDKNGTKKWVQTAGVSPAHFAPLWK